MAFDLVAWHLILSQAERINLDHERHWICMHLRTLGTATITIT